MNTDLNFQVQKQVELRYQALGIVLCSLASTVIELSEATFLFNNWLISMETTELEGQAIRPTISHPRKDSEIGAMWQWQLMTIVVNSFPLQSISVWPNLI